MSRECPVTGATCHGPECQSGKCAFEDYPFERKRGGKKVELGDMVIKALADQAAAIERLTREKECPEKTENKPILVLTTFINNQLFIMADIQLTLGATPKDGIFALVDTVTGGILTGVTFSGQTVGANSNPAAATFAIDPADTTGNSVLPTPLAAGSGTCVFGATASYNDSKGNPQTNVSFTVVKNFTVILGADGVTLDIVF